jgi:choline-sulfatase
MSFRDSREQRNSFILWLCVSAVVTLTCCNSTRRDREGHDDRDRTLRPFNVVLVTIDTLRADRVGCYGNSAIQTPELDKLAGRGVLFENAIAQAPLTAPSHASMMTGLYPTTHKVRDTGGFVLSPSYVTLATILHKQGWDTAAFVGSSVLKKRFGFNQGFVVYDDEMPRRGSDSATGNTPERRAGEVVDRAIAWLQSRPDKPFFLWVHVYDPHLPYDPPSPFREKYKGRPYEGEIAYTDQQLGRLFQALEKQSAPEKTLTAVLSDHGESFSEHGEYSHGVFLYDSTLQIPFLLAGPGVPAGRRVKQQARTIDVLPTILDLMGGRIPENVQGVPLTGTFRGTENPAALSYIESMYPKLNMGWAELRGIRSNRWKYIRAPKSELYDLTEDPAESKNVIESHPTEVEKFEAALKSLSGTGVNHTAEKVETAPVDPRTTEQLRSLGYLGGSGRQQYEMTGKGIDPKDRTEVLKRLYNAVYSPLSLPKRIALLEQAISMDHSNPSLYYNLGDLYAEAGRANDAAKLYRDALASGVRSSWLYSRLGLYYSQHGKKQDAITFFEAASQSNPSDYESLGHLAAAYREAGRLDEAERICRSILSSGEEYAPAYNELGMASFQKGDVAKARSYFEKAAQLDSAFQLNLGRLYRMAGDNARARASYEAFLRANASRPEYREVVPRVQQELSDLK